MVRFIAYINCLLTYFLINEVYMNTLHYKISQNRSRRDASENAEEIAAEMRDRVLDNNEEITFDSPEETRVISRASIMGEVEEDNDLQVKIYNLLIDGQPYEAATVLQDNFEALVYTSLLEAINDWIVGV